MSNYMIDETDFAVATACSREIQKAASSGVARKSLQIAARRPRQSYQGSHLRPRGAE